MKVFLSMCFVFPVLNTEQFSPCLPPSVWCLSTSWFKDGAPGFPRLPSPSDFWVSTATGQLSVMSCFPGNTPVELHPSKFCMKPTIISSFTLVKYLSSCSDLYSIAVMEQSLRASVLPVSSDRTLRPTSQNYEVIFLNIFLQYSK